MPSANLGSLDLFAVPVNLFGARRKSHSGSRLGCLLTIILLVLIIGLIGMKVPRLSEFGNYTSIDIPDDLNDKEFKMDQFNFMPSVSITLLDQSDTNYKVMRADPQLDIWDTN